MSKTANVIARIDPSKKEKAEAILKELGIPVSVVIDMLYSQIIIHNGLPFDVKMPRGIDSGNLSKDENDAISLMTLNDLQNGNYITFDNFVDKVCAKYNITREELLDTQK
ncbi:MAG: type II toxin-antitoxin system RelB/DinJ family antitoxin [Clostridia bacterium]|nr:type II toxin-antitoxin system RelB/DinJ family antitoxin [Clostridia bacterium]